jgi:hypothetical protein
MIFELLLTFLAFCYDLLQRLALGISAHQVLALQHPLQRYSSPRLQVLERTATATKWIFGSLAFKVFS